MTDKHEPTSVNEEAQVAEEISDQDVQAFLAGGAASGISSWLGNNGRYCTLTKECMRFC